MNSRFLQIHFLTSYPGALLNRDDAGFAKRLPFGGTTRTRISSQCLKRHWRVFDGEHALRGLDVPQSIRSRYTFERYVYEPLVKEGVSEELARPVTAALIDLALGKSDKAEAKKAGGGKKGKKAKDLAESEATASEEAPAADAKSEGLMTNQLTVLGFPEVEYLRSIAFEVCKANPTVKAAVDALKARLGKDEKKNLQQMKHAAGLDAALFGRMVTSDILARGDAALHVAHAFTVHTELSETDYFTAVDDLTRGGDDDQLGSAHINNSELTSGLYYGYVVVDVPLLVSNLEGCRREDWEKADRALAAKVVESLVHLVATVSPGAKLGSTAPHGYASLVFAEAGNAQPRTLANAFLKPVAERPDLLANTYAALAGHVESIDGMYGVKSRRQLSAMGLDPALCSKLSVEAPVALDKLAAWAGQQIKEG